MSASFHFQATKIKNTTRQTTLAERVFFCRTFKDKLTGLLGQSSLEPQSALVIPGCNGIHTFFMQLAIDVLFLDAHRKVVGIIESMVPFRISPIFWQARLVIELHSQTIKNTSTQIADTILIEY